MNKLVLCSHFSKILHFINYYCTVKHNRLAKLIFKFLNLLLNETVSMKRFYAMKNKTYFTLYTCKQNILKVK